MTMEIREGRGVGPEKVRRMRVSCDNLVHPVQGRVAEGGGRECGARQEARVCFV